MTAKLSTFFSPKSIAVIGASDVPEKVGAIVLRNIIASGFSGNVYPVNPSYEKLENLKCYKDVKSLPELPDLAVIAIPAALNAEVLNQIGEVGIKNVVSYAAGFKEAGKDGEKLELELAGICKKYKINLLGPNCFGFVNNSTPLNATFGAPSAKPGNLRFVMQSGALAASLFDWCGSQNLGFSQFVTLGNKTILNENDFLRYFSDDLDSLPAQAGGSRLASLTLRRSRFAVTESSSVSPIGLYLESISDGPEFLKIVGEISKVNPVFILKPGVTAASASAMKSHTGSIAGEDYVLSAALAQVGAIRCETLQEFFDLSKAFSWSYLPKGPKVAIVSNAGGPAVISCDAIALRGLELAKFSRQTEEVLATALPRAANLLNPVDVLGDALSDRFAAALEAVLKEEEVNAVVVILTPQVMTEISKTAQVMGALHRKYQKPILCSFIGGSLVHEGKKVLNDLEIPNFGFPEQAVWVLSKLWEFGKNHLESDLSKDSLKASSTVWETLAPPQRSLLDKSSSDKIIDTAIKAGHKTLDNFEANELISLFGIPVPPSCQAKSFDDAIKFTRECSFPVVAKLSSPGLLHKKEIGGVVTDIRNEAQLEAAWDFLERRITHLDEPVRGHMSIQIQKEVEEGVEVIVGVKDDPTFGKVMLFGAGGSLAQLVSDRNLHLLPIDLGQAERLVQSSKVYALLKGGPHEPPHCLDKLYELMVNLGRAAESSKEISEIEVNPVIVTLNNVWAVDGKVILSKGPTPPASPPQFQSATAVGREILSAKFHYFEFETESPFNFEPGQYVSVKVASDRINCYSIAGRPSERKFNLFVDTAPGGPGSKFFDALKVGEKITFLGPFGVFTLKPNDGAKQLLFLGTGCGFAPLKYMIESALYEDKVKIPVALYLGVNYPQDIFFKDYLDNLSNRFPNFTYKFVVFKPDGSWKGLTGFITQYIGDAFPDASGVAAYLCGNKFMIADCTSALLSHGCLNERIYFEKL